MSGWRGRVDLAFERWGRFVCRRRWATIVCTLVLALVPGSKLSDLEIKASLQDFLHPDDPTRRLYEEFRRTYGHDQLVLIAVEAPEVFDLDFLAELRRIHRELEQRVPHLQEITSLVNARWTRESDGQLVVGDLLAEWPESPGDVAQLRERVFADPLYMGTLISRDAGLTTILVKPDAFTSRGAQIDALAGFDDGAGASPAFLTDEENVEILREIRAVLAAHEGPHLRFHLAGAPVLEELIDTVMRRDLLRFTVLSSLGILGVMFLLFRNVWAVVLPFCVVGLSLACAIGIMVLLGYALLPTIQFIPPFLLAVGLCDSVHLLVPFFDERRKGATPENAIAHALRHSGLPIVMTSLTTAAGLGAFAGARLVPVAFLGVIGPLGVMLALLFTVTLLPALLTTVPIGGASWAPLPADASALGRLLLRCGDLGARRPRAVVFAFAALVLLSALGASRLRFGHNALDWFPPEEPLRQATQLLDERLEGVMSIEMILRMQEEEALHDPAVLGRLEQIARDAESLRRGDLRVGKTVSIVDIAKEIHCALNGGRSEFRAIPAAREAVAQELLLFENAGSDDLSDFADTRMQTARLTLKVPWVDASYYPAFLDALEERARNALGPGVEVSTTGASAVQGRVLAAVVTSTAQSYVLAFLLITPMMVAFVGRLGRGILAMVPNVVPIVFVLGLMGWADIPVDSASLLVGAIILGLAVDDTIHFMHKFGQYWEHTGDARRAVRETLRTTGMALLFTTLVLAAGFLSFTTAYMANVAVFGGLAGFAALAAFVADVVLGPALMTLAVRGGSGGFESPEALQKPR